jgi:hypothetical protein
VSRRTLVYIILAVITAHLGLFFLLAHTRALPQVPHAIPPPNFGFHEVVRENASTGERTVTREFNVSTKLSPTAAARPAPVTGRQPVTSDQ